MTFAYLDISIGGDFKGRVVVELFDKVAPLASNNFLTLCKDKKYVNTFFHRVIRNFIIQGGDINSKDNNEKTLDYPIENIGKDTANTSIYNDYFKDENKIDIEKRFMICMSNFGKKNHNSSQFFITVEKAPHLNGKHTVFGNIKYGRCIIREIEKMDVFSNKNSDNNAWVPITKVIITDCGEWNQGDLLPNKIACADTIGGDIYEEYPDDNDIENLDLENPEQTLKITSIIKESATLIFKQKRYDDALLKYKKALRYCNELIPDDESKKELYKKFQDLKKTLYLNLSLVTLTQQNYESTINYCGYLLQMEDVELTNIQASKVFYRLGKSYACLKKYDIALETLSKGLLVSPDDASIKKEVIAVKKVVDAEKKEEQAKYAKFFS
ncbi:hypothetical protein C6P40_002791 [Pichia californica]|uniref:peptidylprolyl isomerase n=1 Tax=Pichia californica TaxID=460514 RepID=A0A9P6WJA8_9ASCO|nr:hypothetical protein C6P42_003173 [[Candida] californica]KAG0687157.1 hypothetical protein C6P40_002791 [[Candida] californica]